VVLEGPREGPSGKDDIDPIKLSIIVEKRENWDEMQIGCAVALGATPPGGTEFLVEAAQLVIYACWCGVPTKVPIISNESWTYLPSAIAKCHC
jgi:hypothetical protein